MSEKENLHCYTRSKGKWVKEDCKATFKQNNSPTQIIILILLSVILVILLIL